MDKASEIPASTVTDIQTAALQAPSAAAPSADAGLRAAFDRVLREGGEKVAPAETEQKADAGRADAVSGAKEKETAAPKESQGRANEPDTAYEDAVKSLRFLGMGTKDLEALGRDRVVELGAKESKRSAEVSTKLNDLQTKLKTVEGAASPKSSEPAVAPVATEGQPIDFAAKVKPIVDLLGMDEVGPVLAEFGKSVYQEASAASQKEITGLRSVVNEITTMLLEIQADRSRARLPENIRQLADDETFQNSIYPKMQSLIATGSYSSLDDALRDASMIVLGPRLQESVDSVRAHKAAARANGSMSSVDPRSVNRVASTEDRLFSVFKAIENGANDADIRAAASGR